MCIIYGPICSTSICMCHRHHMVRRNQWKVHIFISKKTAWLLDSISRHRWGRGGGPLGNTPRPLKWISAWILGQTTKVNLEPSGQLRWTSGSMARPAVFHGRATGLLGRPSKSPGRGSDRLDRTVDLRGPPDLHHWRPGRLQWSRGTLGQVCVSLQSEGQQAGYPTLPTSKSDILLCTERLPELTFQELIFFLVC